MSTYYVSHAGTQEGPWSLDEIVSKVKASQLSLMDYLYDETKQDWILLMEFGPLALQLTDHKPQQAPKVLPIKKEEPENKQSASPDQREWYILKGENKFGPFAYSDVVRMLQQKAVYEFDFTWFPGLDTWKRIAEMPDFAPAKIRQLKQSGMKDIEEVFFRRRHNRVQYGGTVLVHDNKSVWKGRGVEISAGGAGVVMENAMINPGQTLYLHFKPGDGVPPFNAICEVVNKKFVQGVENKDAPVHYGLKFVNLSVATQKFLQDYTSKKTANAA